MMALLLGIVPAEERASYIGLVNTVLGVVNFPPILSGTIIDWVGFEPVFFAVTGLLLLGYLATLGRVVDRLTSRPLVGPLLRPCFSAEGNEAIVIPVQEAVRGAESMVLPYPLLTPLLERASARFIKSGCLCRPAEGCQAYPQGVGCIFLADGAAEINSAMGRLVNADDAMAHVQRAMDVGLVPLVVHSSFDAWMLGIPSIDSFSIVYCSLYN